MERIRHYCPGWMVNKWWDELNNKFPGLETDEYLIMPNHFHGNLITEYQAPIISDDKKTIFSRPDPGEFCPRVFDHYRQRFPGDTEESILERILRDYERDRR